MLYFLLLFCGIQLVIFFQLQSDPLLPHQVSVPRIPTTSDLSVPSWSEPIPSPPHQVSVEELEEKLLAFEDHIQSMDIVVFNKI